MLSQHPTLHFKDVAKRKTDCAKALLERNRVYYTYNGRGAIYQLLRAMPAIKGNSVLLPAFHCPTVVEPVVRAGFRVLFYRINRDLSINSEDLRSKLSNDIAAIIVINYCGFPADIDFILKLRERYDYYVVEDWAHSFLSGNPERLTGDRGDMSIFSFYKLVPSYAGGGLRINRPEFPFQPSGKSVGPKHSIVLLKRLLEQIVNNSDGGVLKAAFQYLENKRVALKTRKGQTPPDTVRSVTELYPFHDDLASAKMPWFCKAILELSDLESNIFVRRRNYNILNDNLIESAIVRKVYRVLPENVCPWAYPVLVSGRAKYDFKLWHMGIPIFTFGELLHPLIFELEGSVRDDAEYLLKSLMMIAIHQNLDSEEVLNISNKINAFFQSCN